jgi:glycosidase
MRKSVVSRAVVVPEWAKDAVWYQVFPERFRNGLRANDPRVEDIEDHPIPGWRVKEWGSDWYSREDWETRLGEFRRSVYHRRYGGDLVGLREKLDYLEALGINAIYLNPVFMAPSLHKYDAACLHHVDPTLGPDRDGDLNLMARAGETENPGSWIWTAADRYLVELIADVHRRGMRIILDGVFNHVGTRFFAFQDLQLHGRASRFRNWFRVEKWNRDGTFEYRGWFGHKTLPELARSDHNLAKPVRDYLYAITRRWMDPNGDGNPGDGVDGWRLDVAFCVPHKFWKDWRKFVKAINPDAFLTAEVVSMADEYLRGDEFDSVMNYMWLFPVFRFFRAGPGALGVRGLRRELDALRRAYPPEVSYVVQNLLDSHDLGRIATALENQLPSRRTGRVTLGFQGLPGIRSLAPPGRRDARMKS